MDIWIDMGYLTVHKFLLSSLDMTCWCPQKLQSNLVRSSSHAQPYYYYYFCYFFNLTGVKCCRCCHVRVKSSSPERWHLYLYKSYTRILPKCRNYIQLMNMWTKTSGCLDIHLFLRNECIWVAQGWFLRMINTTGESRS